MEKATCFSSDAAVEGTGLVSRSLHNWETLFLNVSWINN